MKFKFLLPVLFSLFCLVQPAFCQITTAPGYIIKASGDTVRGQLEFVNNNIPGKRAFIPAGSGRLEFLKKDAIQAYYINPEIHFKTLPINGKKVYLQVLSEGAIDLLNHRSDLFILSKTGTLEKLEGGTRTVDRGGKKYLEEISTYKAQIRKNLPDGKFDQDLNALRFKKKAIRAMVYRINGQQPAFRNLAPLKHKHQFEVRAGFTRNRLRLINIPYSSDTLKSNNTFTSIFGKDPATDAAHTLSGISAGVYYKKKIGTKYNYLKAGLAVNKGIKRQETQTRDLYRGFTSGGPNGDYPTDTIGKAVDTYTFKLNTLDIPLSYYAELTDGRIRPFLELGVTTRIYSEARVTLKREIHNEFQLLRTETGQMELPDLTVNPTIGVGCRYLRNADRSILAGLNSDAWFTQYIFGEVQTNLITSSGISFFIAYGF